MANGNSIENNLCEAIEYIVNHAVESAGYDRTIQATIIECTDESIGKYKVKYQDSTFYAYSQSIDVTYTNGSDVYILVPGNDMTRDKTILGTTKKLGSNYTNNAEGDEAYEVIGKNCIDSQDNFELCSYSSNMVQVIYDKNDSSKNQITLNLTSVETYLKQSSSIICGAIVRTALPVEQQFRGNYGIVFELNFSDNATGKVITKNYVVDVNQMRGNPYKITHDTRQYGIFNIDNKNFIDVNRIYLFVYDFPNRATGKPADIFIKNLELSGANALTDEELSACALTFITPQGIYFDDNDLDSAIRTIQAEVRVKGKVVDHDSQQLTYYWFIENVGISTKSEKYNKYGGAGWQCLNNYNVVKPGDDMEAPVVEWVPGEYQYQVKKSDSAARETKYKCVVLYDSLVLSKEITIINFSSNYLITIESDSGTKFYYDIGTPTLTCKINDTEQVTDDYEYVWAEIDSNNNFFSLSETTDDNNIYNNAVAAYNALMDEIEAGTKLPAASQEELEEYLTIIENYDTIMRVERNKLHKVQVNTIMNFSTFKCSVFYKGVFIGTSSIVITNSLEAEDVYTLIINNSSQVFKYNESGIAPTSNTVENPYEIPPLSFVVYDNLGNEIPNDVLEQCDIQWIVPTENTMLDIPNVFDENKTNVDLINHTETYSDLMSISYTIAERYAVAKKNNNIQLVVNYKGMNLTATTNFTFAKEGDPGTNGTDFLCRILPNVASGDAPLYPMLLNGELNYTPRQNGKWFKVQLWHNGEMIFDGTENGSTSEGKTLAVVWSVLRNKYSTSISDNTDIEINATTGFCTYNGYVNNSAPANIIKCTLEYDGIEYYATMPLITGTSSDNYKIALKEYTGFRFATYSADGRRPQYDNTNPFELIVTQNINGFEEDISQMTNQYQVEYQWNIRGKIYNPVTKVWDLNINLDLKNKDDGYNKSPLYFKPLDNYNGECVNNALECIVTQNSNEITRIHIPIHLLLNKYGQAAINDWDGNSVSIDKDGCGVILAPQIGAGKKENDNSFTGMLMGQVKEAGQSNADVGLIGYHQGQRTIHISAYDGYAIFGKNGPGQIILDPSSSNALIYSNNFWEDYYDDNTNSGKNGLPQTTYAYSESTHKYTGQKNLSTEDMQNTNAGMLIDLTTPRILFGSGNFRVDPNGFLYAKGGGQIAGWKINDYRIDSIDRGTGGDRTGKTGMSSVYELDANGVTSKSVKLPDSSQTSGYRNENKAIAFWAGNDNFFVSHDGYLKANEASIGSGSNPIFIGKSTGNSNASAIFSGKKSSFTTNANGFYIGTDGIALGSFNDNGESRFQVTSQGILTAREGHIGGWEITRNTIEAGNIVLNSNGSMYGGNGDTGWTISQSGAATFKTIYASNKGTIGGWTINGNKIQGGNVTLNANGNIDCTGGNGWYIHSDGSARFGNFRINTAGNITANGGDFNNVDVSGTINATSGRFQNCTIDGSCTIGGERVDGAFVKNANIASGAVTNGKIATGAITASKISAGAVTADKLNVNSLSAITADFGDKVYFGSGSYIDGSNNGMQWTNNVGFLTMGLSTSHPYMSAANVSGVNGLSLRSGNSVSNSGGELGYVKSESGVTSIGGNNGIKLDDKVTLKNGITADGSEGKTCTVSGGVVVGVTDMTLNFKFGILVGASGNWVN